MKDWQIVAVCLLAIVPLIGGVALLIQALLVEWRDQHRRAAFMARMRDTNRDGGE